MGVSEAEFYEQNRIAIVPMAFCFPGYDGKGSDLPPPKRCAAHWRDRVLGALSQVRLTLLVGGYAQKWHLRARASGGVSQTVQYWKDHTPHIFALPHPSWRNSAWLKKNPWFEADLLPVLQSRVREELDD